MDPGIAATDQAIAKGDPKVIHQLLASAIHQGLEARWTRIAAEKPPADDVAAGRRWVAAYVPLMHWVEAVNGAAGAASTRTARPAADAHAAHAGQAEAQAEKAPAKKHVH